MNTVALFYTLVSLSVISGLLSFNSFIKNLPDDGVIFKDETKRSYKFAIIAATISILSIALTRVIAEW